MRDQSSPPPTLLEISGAAYPAGRLADSIVVIVDAQRVYVDGRLFLPGVNAALAEIALSVGLPQEQIAELHDRVCRELRAVLQHAA